MLVLATFFPMNESGTQQQMDVIGEFMKSTMDLSDLLGLHLLMLRIPGRGEMKVLVAGLGNSFLIICIIVIFHYF